MSNNEILIVTDGEHIRFRTIIKNNEIISCEVEGKEGYWLPPTPILKVHTFPIPIRDITALRNNLHQAILAVCGPPTP